MEDRKELFTYKELYALSLILLIFALIIQPNSSLIEGFIKIHTLSNVLITDYMEVGGIGVGFFNASFMLFIHLIVCQYNNAKLNGTLIAGLFNLIGFSFFGKNIVNTIPLSLGVILYISYQKLDMSKSMHFICYSGGISPLVSFIFFALGWPSYISIPAGIIIGILVGFIIIPLSSNMANFHLGFNLYNMGFTVGIIALGIAGFFRMFGYEVANQRFVYEGDDTAILLFLFVLMSIFLVYGLYVNGGIKGYKKLIKEKCKAKDFVNIYGKGIVLINASFLGLIALVYTKLSQGTLNGPIIGATFSMIGFGAYGKTPRTVIPILLGVYLAAYLNIYEVTSTESILIALFGTTLSPLSSYYGFFIGVLAGFLHYAVSSNIGMVHGGLNLYNNGLAGGFVAGLFAPLLDVFKDNKINKDS